MAEEICPDEESKEAGADNILELNTSVGAAIADMVRTTLGPAGMDKMLVDSDGMVLVTNDGRTILGEMDVELNFVPAAKFLSDLALDQDQSVGDGTTTVTVIAGALLREAEELFDRGVHPTSIAQGYVLAAERAKTVLENVGTPFSFDDEERLEHIIRTAIAGTGGEIDNKTIVSLVVDAADELAVDGGFDPDDLLVEKIVGGRVNESSLMRGALIKAEPVHAGMPHCFEPGKIACLNTDLQVHETSTSNAEFKLQKSDDVTALLDYEASSVEKQIDTIVESGTNAILSNAGINETAQQLLAERGVMAAKRLSTDDLRMVANATGATITDARILEPTDVGEVTRVEYRNLGGNDTIALETDDASRVSLVLRGGTEHILDEMERAIRNSLSTLNTVAQDGRIIPGGGAVEMEVAQDLRTYADSVSEREQLAIEAFADAMETIPRSLAETAGMDQIDTLLDLRHRHTKGETAAGIDVTHRCVADVLEQGIIDSAEVKQYAIVSAADVVARIIRIDDILDAERSDEIK